MNILQYESKIWATADLLRGSGIKESEWPSFMMPFFALAMIESRLVRMFDNLKEEIGEAKFAQIKKDDLYDMIRDEGQGYNVFIFEKNQTLKDICKNDKSFEIDFDAYLKGFDGETKDLLGVDAGEGEKFLDIKGVVTKLKAKKVLLGYTKLWAEIDLKPFNNSEITTLEEHIKRKWADISAETAGEQYTPDDVIALIAEIIASKIEDNDKLLKIYDCTCGGGNMLFGVEDRINQKFKRLTQTFGQDWNDALYALAKIESRFRPDSKIEHGNTLVEDKFYNEEFDVVIANPPYGVSWKGYEKDINNDKTERFKFIPSISDGQLLFMQHLISKLDSQGIGVVVHNGSTLFSGDAGSAESNIRKWMLDSDIVEAIIQLPTNEFFNTGIYTYLWVLNKNKAPARKDKLMLINASEKFSPLKKAKGEKRKEVDESNRLDIVATLAAFEDNDYARVFDKEFFYYNKQAIMLTNVDENGRSFESHLVQGKKSLKLNPTQLTNGERTIVDFEITTFDNTQFKSLADYFENDVKPFIASIDYKEQPLVVTCGNTQYHFDNDKETLIKAESGILEDLGCGKIVVKPALKNGTKSQSERIEITVELTPDYQKDYEIIPHHKDPIANNAEIEAFMSMYIHKPFEYLENVLGVEINFNKIFYKPEKLIETEALLKEIKALDNLIANIEDNLSLINETVTRGLDKSVPMKDSDIEWIGEVPAHWEVKRIADIAKQNKTKNNGMIEKNLLSLSYGKIIRKDLNTTFGLLPDSFETYQIVKQDSIILRLTDLQNDQKSLRVGHANEKGIITSAYIGLNFNKSVNSKFAYYLLHVFDLCKVFYWFGGGLRSTMRYEDLKVIPFLIPPLKEQKAIADYLDEKTEKIDQIVITINQQIENLKELRKTLINDVVTGQLKVTQDDRGEGLAA